MRGARMLLVTGSVLVIIVFLFSLFFSSTAKMQRAGVINAPASVVLQQLSDTTNWNKWYPWPLGSGSQHGALVFEGIEQDSLLRYSIVTPDASHPIKGSFYLQPLNNGTATAINWSIERHVGLLPWWKIRGVMMDRIYGPSMEDGLTSLKKLSEAAAGDTTHVQ